MRSGFITHTGYTTLCNELDWLLRTRRPEVTRAVSEAAALGDRSENADYIYGKKLLREIDRRVRFLQNRLPELTVVERKPDNLQRVYFGAWVTLETIQGDVLTVRIVGSDEIDPNTMVISIDAPMAKALLTKSIDDEVKVPLPNGCVAHYWIVGIQYDGNLR